MTTTQEVRDPGRRVVRTEWGNRYPAIPGEDAGGTEPAVDERQARRRAKCKYHPGVVVSRQVVTYTTNWAVTPGARKADAPTGEQGTAP